MDTLVEIQGFGTKIFWVPVQFGNFWSSLPLFFPTKNNILKISKGVILQIKTGSHPYSYIPSGKLT